MTTETDIKSTANGSDLNVPLLPKSGDEEQQPQVPRRIVSPAGNFKQNVTGDDHIADHVCKLAKTVRDTGLL